MATVFVLPTETGERLSQAFAGRVCTAEDGSYIARSDGRRRAGRQARYFVHLVGGGSFTITAEDDRRAVDGANRRLQ